MIDKLFITNGWTLIASRTQGLSIQNVGQYPVYLSWSDSDASSPVDDIGHIFETYEKAYKLDPTVTFNSNAEFIWSNLLMVLAEVWL
ncbi:MAG: hypothetical protein COA84_13255 [Robiginitomaculum sp.]|nr:MAG: hypothetical protein COA84_13255 [Robiginitomaculum sp.]